MSLDYASSLSPYPNKGKLGLPEHEEPIDQVELKCDELANLIMNSNHLVVITGAGLSTSCGIPDFRGPNGVWTLEKKGLKPEQNMTFQEAIPSLAHYVLVKLADIGKLKFLISQNIDGLHMRSGFPMNRLAEVHGNMFLEKCSACNAKYVLSKNVTTIGLKPTGRKCTREKPKGICRGHLIDTILDWEDALPNEEMAKSELNCKKSDLIICLGTSLQIMPVGNYPLMTKKNNGKIVIINLQQTRMDKNADLIINSKLDIVFEILAKKLHLNLNIKNKIEINLKLENDLDSNLDRNSLLLNVSNIIIDPDYKMNNKTKIEPNLVLIISGKRKCGKDYLSKKLVEYYKSDLRSDLISLHSVTISAPLKEAYAKENNLNYEKLLDSSDYKENFRKSMIEWSDSKRKIDPGYFCRIAIKNIEDKLSENNTDLTKKFFIYLITDARRKTDLEYFKTTFPNLIKTIRINASEQVRSERDWVFTPGVDDTPSECDLDDYKSFDFQIENNKKDEFENSFNKLINYIDNMYKINMS